MFIGKFIKFFTITSTLILFVSCENKSSSINLSKNNFQSTNSNNQNSDEKYSSNSFSSFESNNTSIQVDKVNLNETLYLNKVAGYSTGLSDPKGCVAEIVKYNYENNKIYLVNGKSQTIDIFLLKTYQDSKELETVYDKSISFSQIVKDHQSDFASDFKVGDITSVAINFDLDLIAVSLQHLDYDKNGVAVILDYEGNYLKSYRTGIQPDMITFADNVILTADEGEPRLGYKDSNALDPKGSVTIIDLEEENPSSTIVSFDNFDSNYNDLIKDKVLIKKDTLPSLDLEPEYITWNKDLAYISLQENNAIATLDIKRKQFISVKGLGFKDHSLQDNGLDLVDDGKINIKLQNVFGVYMPDGIDAFVHNNKTYIATANEGDAREFNEYSVVKKYSVDGSKVETLDNSEFEALDKDKHYLFGTRSFSIFDAETMECVFDSKDMIEKAISESKYKAYFNCDNDNVNLDARSKKKGIEPEAIKIVNIDDKTFAFVALERQGGAMMFDITNFQDVKLVSYANSRDYSKDMAGDVAPESIDFIHENYSLNEKNVLVLANENSGTVAFYALENIEKEYIMHD